MVGVLSSIEILTELVRFDTTSRNSNLALIEWVEEYLGSFNVRAERVPNADGSKSNLYATLGPEGVPGIALSGHTDVVPARDEGWHSPPFELTLREDRLYGRGSADMKGFIAAVLAAVPAFVSREIETPWHLVLSYDEELGCLGVRGLLAELERRPVRPKACIVGEPTAMLPVRAHKGKHSYRCTLHGKEAHSSLPHQGVNAVEAAAAAVDQLRRMALRLRDHGGRDEGYSPPYTSIHTGLIHGGTALNVVPQQCSFDFEIRHLPQDDPRQLFGELVSFVNEQLLPDMAWAGPQSGFSWEPLTQIPALDTPWHSDLLRLVQRLLDAEGSGKVSFATEAGLFQQIGIPAVVLGPGRIEQAHQPDEYLELEQLKRCERFLQALMQECWKH